MEDFNKARTEIIIFKRKSEIKIFVFKDKDDSTHCHLQLEDLTICFPEKDRDLVEYLRSLSKLFEDTASIIFKELK